MTIYLDHPLHGAFVVYSPAEAEAMGKNGWVIRNPQPGQPKVEVPRVVGVDTDGDGKIDQVFARKPGRPKKAE